MTLAIDLTGKRFGRLTALHSSPRAGGPTRWACLCDCGRDHTARTGNLMSGAVKSCGCLNGAEAKRARAIIHGWGDTPEYNAWTGMRARCSTPSNRAYKNYGGRGIKVCARWDASFEAFLEDMGPRPSPQHSLDRHPNNDGNYEPENCRWATKREQNNNRRSNRLVTYRGKTQTLMEATRSIGAPYDSVLARIQRGWNVTDALETPMRVIRNG